MTIKELREKLEELSKDDKAVDDGTTIRVFMPGGDQMDVLSVSAHDAAAREKGEKYVGLRLDTPMNA